MVSRAPLALSRRNARNRMTVNDGFASMKALAGEPIQDAHDAAAMPCGVHVPGRILRDIGGSGRRGRSVGRLRAPLSHWGFTGPRLSLGGVGRDAGIHQPIDGIRSGRSGSPGTGDRTSTRTRPKPGGFPSAGRIQMPERWKALLLAAGVLGLVLAGIPAAYAGVPEKIAGIWEKEMMQQTRLLREDARRPMATTRARSATPKRSPKN